MPPRVKQATNRNQAETRAYFSVRTSYLNLVSSVMVTKLTDLLTYHTHTATTSNYTSLTARLFYGSI